MKTTITALEHAATRGYTSVQTALATFVARRLHAAEEGQGTAEYVAIIVLVAGLVGLVATNGQSIIQAIGNVIQAGFERVETIVGGGGGE